MSGTYSILNIGYTALLTQRIASDVASHNIANVNTVGYSRQSADIQATLPYPSSSGPVGSGVEVNSILQQRNLLLERSYLSATSDQGFSSGQLGVLQAAETVVGVGDDDTISSALSNFFTALQTLSNNPAGTVERQGVLNAATQLSNSFSQVRANLSDTRAALDTSISGLVSEIQKRADEVATLNHDIRLTEASGGNANDLRDRRVQLVSEIAERIGVTTFTDKDGNLNVMLSAGGTLVEGDHSASLQTVADPTNDGLLSPVLVSSSGARTTLNASCGGKLGGQLSARDGDIKQTIGNLDQLAFDLAARINQVHSVGFGADGLGGRDLYAPLAAVSGAAANLQLDAAVAGHPEAIAAALDPAAVPGDNRNALALADLAQTSLIGGSSAGDYWQSCVSALGTGVQNASRDTDLNSARLTQLTQMRESVSGVSTDEEMIELSKAQTAFSAAAKVIQTGDQLLKTILELKAT